MKIYIDFDGTIYNSGKLYKNFINIFNNYNIDTKYIEETLNNSNQKDLDNIANKIIKEKNLNKNIIQELNNINTKDLVFKDIIPFLEKYTKKYDLILLTLGNHDYQEKKINSTNISKYFKDIIITNKDKSKLESIDYINGIFIDNNPIELKKFYNSKATNLIRIRRNEDKYSKLDLNLFNIPEFTSFKELDQSNHLQKIGVKTYE